MQNLQVELSFGKLNSRKLNPWLLNTILQERPAAILPEIKSIDDTSNFDDFPESDILQPGKTVSQLTTFKSL